MGAPFFTAHNGPSTAAYALHSSPRTIGLTPVRSISLVEITVLLSDFD